MTLDDMGERRRKARHRFSNVKRRDERIKLAANYFNGVAIGSVVIGILQGVFDEDVDASFVDAFCFRQRSALYHYSRRSPCCSSFMERTDVAAEFFKWAQILWPVFIVAPALVALTVWQDR